MKFIEKLSGFVRRLEREKLLAFLFLLVVLWFTQPIAQNPGMFKDSHSYIHGWAVRPPSYHAVLAIFGYGQSLIQIQSAFSIISWALAGWMLARFFGLAIFTMLAASRPVAQWNLMILSESCSYSSVALSLAATACLFHRWSRSRLLFWVLAVTFMTFVRTSNVYIVPLLVLPFLIRPWRQWLTAGLLALSLYLAGTTLSATRGVYYEQMILSDVILYSILPDPEAREFFRERGMPLNETVMEYSGMRTYKNYTVLWKRVPEFKEWLTPDGVRTYKLWLLHDLTSFRQAWDALNQYRTGRGHCLWYGSGFQHRALSTWLIPYYVIPGDLPSWVWLSFLILPVVEYLGFRKWSVNSVMLVVLMLLTYSQTYICYHGSPDEFYRHMFISGLLYRVTILTALLLAVSLIWKAPIKWPIRSVSPLLTR